MTHSLVLQFFATRKKAKKIKNTPSNLQNLFYTAPVDKDKVELALTKLTNSISYFNKKWQPGFCPQRNTRKSVHHAWVTISTLMNTTKLVGNMC